VVSALGGSLESGSQFCVCAFDRNLASSKAVLLHATGGTGGIAPTHSRPQH
jgi:hypothetical protein